MDFDSYIIPIVDFVRVHQAWAAPVVFVLCFAESLAFISLLIPAWGVLVGLGALISASGLNFWPIWLAGSLGAALGALIYLACLGAARLVPTDRTGIRLVAAVGYV